MKKYMGYDVGFGSGEGAALIFANTEKEAKKVFWRENPLEIESFLDVRVELLKYGHGFLEKEKQSAYPHVVMPKSCSACNMWGISEIGDDGLCDDCRKEKEAGKQ
jgi:hypothetical protein